MAKKEVDIEEEIQRLSRKTNINIKKAELCLLIVFIRSLLQRISVITVTI